MWWVCVSACVWDGNSVALASGAELTFHPLLRPLCHSDFPMPGKYFYYSSISGIYTCLCKSMHKHIKAAVLEKHFCDTGAGLHVT